MELWQVRKDYRRLAGSLRRRKEPMGPSLEGLEERVLVTIVLGDRFETELCVLRLARRCARARLRRLLGWVENAGLLRSAPARLSRKKDELAAEDLARALEQSGHAETAGTLRQLLDELAHLERRLEETRARVGRIASLAAGSLELLVTHMRVRLNPPPANAGRGWPQAG